MNTPSNKETYKPVFLLQWRSSAMDHWNTITTYIYATNELAEAAAELQRQLSRHGDSWRVIESRLVLQ